MLTAIAGSSALPLIKLVSIVEQAIANPDIDLDKMERLLALQERVMARQAEMDFDNAMAMAQNKMQPIRVDLLNPQTRKKYASYSAIDSAIRPIYSQYGFSLSFDTEDTDNRDEIRIVCFVSCAGHKSRRSIRLLADGKGARGGEAMTPTHAKRIGLHLRPAISNKADLQSCSRA